jgi:hypothetical protein
LPVSVSVSARMLRGGGVEVSTSPFQEAADVAASESARTLRKAGGGAVAPVSPEPAHSAGSR